MTPWVSIMNKTEAELYLVASRDNPFVAAWLAILDVHKLPPSTPVAPHDWWDAFQNIYCHNLVDNALFSSLNVEKTFFGRRHPSSAELSDAMHHLKQLRQMADGPQECAAMSNNKIAIFESDERAIAKPARATPRDVFEPRQSPGGLEIFEQPSALEPRPRTTDVRRVQPFEEVRESRHGTALDCVGVDPHPYVADSEFVILCCGQPIDITQDDGDIIDPGHAEEGPLLEEMIFHGTCVTCERVFHCSSNRKIPRDSVNGL